LLVWSGIGVFGHSGGAGVADPAREQHSSERFRYLSECGCYTLGRVQRRGVVMGKADRRRRQERGPRVSASAGRGLVPGGGAADDPRAGAEAALVRLVRLNPPGKVSLAGAYALGYCALGLAQQDEDGPEWFCELDPLDTLFLGTVWPQECRDVYEFANAHSAWLHVLRGTAHWRGVERFVGEVLAASEEHDLPVDEGELMLLLAGRLEAAGLDQRKIPRDLLPDRLLAEARLAYGPDADFVLPDPPPDAAVRVARLWAGTEVGVLNDGTAADALREGLGMLGSAGVDVRASSAVLLPALYAALVARDDEDLSEAGERAVGWALGLDDDSPLVPVTDVLLVAPERGLDADAVLGHLFGIPAFSEQVRAQDRRWHSSPGTELIGLAFELGHPQVITRDGKAIRLDQGGVAMLQAQSRRFEEKFGRPPGPGDPLFFDPDADEPQPFSLLGIEDETVAMLEAAGISAAWIYAHQHTDGLLPRHDGSFNSESDRAEWQEAVDRYVKLHQPDEPVDHEAEAGKLQNVLVGMTLGMAADDPEYAASLAARLTDSGAREDSEAALLRTYLRAWADDLTSQLRADPAIEAVACEYARAWAGADAAERVRGAAHEPAGDSITDAALLAMAVAATHCQSA
jgi:hypothetical protein